jgi:hypothetical protein
VRVLLGVSQHRRIIQGTERVGNSTSPCLFQARLGALGGELRPLRGYRKTERRVAYVYLLY